MLSGAPPHAWLPDGLRGPGEKVASQGALGPEM